MKIIHITYGFGLGGIETMLHNIANEQVALGQKIYIIVINDIINKELKNSLDPRIKFICLKRKVSSKSILPFIKLNYLLFKINPDIIHLHYSSIARFIFIPSLLHKTCVTQHDVCNKQNSQYLYKCKRIYAISNIVKTDIKKWTGLDSEVVLNGIDVDKIKHQQYSQTEIKLFKIVQVSRLMHEKKGQHILIQAVNKLIRQGYNQIRLDFIGDGESHEYLEGLVKELDIKEYVRFLGNKDQSYIYEHLCDYNLFVQPSIYEGFGLTVTEAMAAKIPVLVSDNQGPMEIIDNGKYGYYFKNKDVYDCAKKIINIITNKKDLVKIESAYNHVKDNFNVKLTSVSYLNHYKEFINDKYASIIK
jgi:glycosyltransferase family 4